MTDALGRRAPLLALGALAVALAGCGRLDVVATPPEASSVAAMSAAPLATSAPTVKPTPLPTASPRPRATLLAFLPVDGDDLKQGLIDSLNAMCPDVVGTDRLMWTCSYRDEVAISVYGPSPASVSAIRLVTYARREVDRRSWMRGYASIFSVAVWQWVDDHFGKNETTTIDGMSIQTTHDLESDGFLISTEPVDP